MVSSQKDLIDSVYNVALEPERYYELILIWKERLGEELFSPGDHLHEFKDDFHRSLQILQAVTPDETGTKPILKDFEASRFAVLAVSETGDIFKGNPAAYEAFGEFETLTVLDLPYDDGSTAAVQAAIARAFRQRSPDRELIRAIHSNQGSASLISVRFASGALDQPSYAIVQTSDFVWPDYLLPMLKSSFELTQAEAEITRLVTEGFTIAAIAKARDSSIATVRTQMRSIFQKTETHSQTELVRMAIAFVALHDAPAADLPSLGGLDGAELEPPELIRPTTQERHVVSLPDGRRLDYSLIGADDGTPVLHISTVFWADYWPAFAAKKVIENGLRIIAPARAGYFRSSLCPAGRSPVEQYAEDVRYLLADLDLERVTILARGMGAMFAFEIARRFPDLVSGMVLVAPELPFQTTEMYENASPSHRFILTTTLKHPKLLELYISAARIYYKRANARLFVEKNFANAGTDFHLLDDLQIMESLQAGLDTTYAAGTKAILQSYQDVKDYSFDQLVACQTSSTTILGSSDASPRRAVAKRMVSAGAKMKLIELENVAEFCFCAKPDLIIEQLLAMSG